MLRDRLSSLSKDNFTLVLILVVAGLTLLAWSQRFVQDDAFISFSYAYNFAHGKGLVWHDGYRVEGYTNFLWTILMSIPLYLGRDPVNFSYALGLISLVGSLVFTYKLARLFLPSNGQALLTIILLGTNYTFSSYATGGLETQLQACLFVSSAYLLLSSVARDRWTNPTSFIISILLALSVLTRPDSLILVAVVVPLGLHFVCRSRFSRDEKVIKAALLLIPFTILISFWAVWKVHYYGNVLPNSYYVKLGTLTSSERGFKYLYAFLSSYWLVPFPLLLLSVSRDLLARANRLLLVPLTITVLWLVYTVKPGGDFMEFRFLLPILPFFFLLIGWLIFAEVRRRELQGALVALLFLGSLHHALTFREAYGIDGIPLLTSYISPQGNNWRGIGEFLGQAFDYDQGVTIATTAAGAIPYYSRLRAIDMLGINDSWVARNGRVLSSRPGHQRIATFNYLVESDVNLVIGNPFLVDNDFSYRYFIGPFGVFDHFEIPVRSLQEIPAGSQLLEIPIEPGRKLFTIYLVQNPHVDQVIRKNGWRTYTLLSPEWTNKSG